MSIVTNPRLKAPRLSAADPNLAFLASRAAIELERILQDKPMGIKAIGELASLLKQSASQAPGATEPIRLWDPATVSLIRNAIATAGFSQIATIDDLMSRAVSIAEELATSAAPSEDKADIRRLRSFCIGLANSAVAHERSQIQSAFEKAHWS